MSVLVESPFLCARIPVLLPSHSLYPSKNIKTLYNVQCEYHDSMRVTQILCVDTGP